MESRINIAMYNEPSLVLHTTQDAGEDRIKEIEREGETTMCA